MHRLASERPKQVAGRPRACTSSGSEYVALTMLLATLLSRWLKG